MPIDYSDPLGVDFHCIDDLDASLTLVSGRTALGHALARRITTPRGGLFYDRDYGDDIRRFLKSTGVSEKQVARMIEAECLKDDRVRAIAATAEFDWQSEALTVALFVTPYSDRGFPLTIIIGALTVELLSEDAVA